VKFFSVLHSGLLEYDHDCVRNVSQRTTSVECVLDDVFPGARFFLFQRLMPS
jgi:hypothetical protein